MRRYDGRMNAKPQVRAPRRGPAFQRPEVKARATAFRRRVGAFAAVLIAAAAVSPPAAAQSQLGQGALLVAKPGISDTSWKRTVVLLLHHDSNGSLGVAINRPTRVSPHELSPELELPDYTGSVFRGGPVGPTQLVFLVRSPPPGLLDSAPVIVDGIRASGDLSAVSRLIELGGDNDGQVRLFAGHVEWAPGQLAREVADGFWTVTNGSAPRVFSPQPETLWDRLLNAGDELLVEDRARSGDTGDTAGISRPPRLSSAAASTGPR